MAAPNTHALLDTVALNGNIAYSQRDMWAWYEVGAVGFDFLSMYGKEVVLSAFGSGLAALLAQYRNGVPFKIVMTSTPFNVDRWKAAMLARGQAYGYGDYYEDYIEQLADTISFDEKGFAQGKVFLGIQLGFRTQAGWSNLNPFTMGATLAWANLVSAVVALMSPKDRTRVTPEEQQAAKQQEEQVFTTLRTGALQVRRASPGDLMVLERKRFFPAMIPADGLQPHEYGDTFDAPMLTAETVAEAQVVEKHNHMEITQVLGDEIYTSYSTTLTLIDFPRLTHYPESIPYFYALRKMNFPFTCSIDGELIEPGKIKTQVGIREQRTKGQLKNLTESQDMYDHAVNGLPSDITTMFECIRLAQEQFKDEGTYPWIKASYHIHVETTELQSLLDCVSDIKQKYRDSMGIKVIQSGGDQGDLFRAQSLAKRCPLRDFDQLTNIWMVGAAGVNLAGEIGDAMLTTEQRRAVER